MSEPKLVNLPCYGMTITDHYDGKTPLTAIATITSVGLHFEDPPEGENEKAFDAAIDGIESIILAHYQAGVDVTTPAYIEGIETAVEAASNNS